MPKLREHTFLACAHHHVLCATDQLMDLVDPHHDGALPGAGTSDADDRNRLDSACNSLHVAMGVLEGAGQSDAAQAEIARAALNALHQRVAIFYRERDAVDADVSRVRSSMTPQDVASILGFLDPWSDRLRFEQRRVRETGSFAL